MNYMKSRAIIISLLLLTTQVLFCRPPLEDNAELDLDVGRGEIAGAKITVLEGLAAIRSLSAGSVTLWLQAPVQKVKFDLTESTRSTWSIVMLNAMPGMALQNSDNVISIAETQAQTTYTADIELAAGTIHTLLFAPDDYNTAQSFSFAMMADVQSAVDNVHDIYKKINDDPTLRFIAFAGDLTSTSTREQFNKFIDKMNILNIPLFATPGNHDSMNDGPDIWHELLGRFNVHFIFKGTAFTLADSGFGTIAPAVYEWIREWTDDCEGMVHFFFTHYPVIDPVGIRGGSFRSRNEAYKLLAILADGDVDAVFQGHVHSYYSYTQAGIQSYISGGGGARPEQFDGVGRHFLKVTVNPGSGIESIKITEID